MSLQVIVKSASNLPNVDVFTKSDPMCRVYFRGISKETKVIDNDLNPEWNETLDPPWEVSDPLKPYEVLQVGVYDQEGKAFRPLGFVDVSLRELAVGNRLELAVDEQLGKGKEGVKLKKDPKKARIQMVVRYTQPPRPLQPTAAGVVGGAKGVEVGGDYDVDEETEEEAEDAGEDGGGAGDSREGATSREQRRKKTSDSREGERKHRARRRKSSRYNLPNKPMDFQVRVHVIEGRKLEGGHISPAVKILCGTDSREVSGGKGSNNPYFNRTVSFVFRERPSELLDRVVEFRVLNSRSFRKDALIGSFKFDLHLVYSEPEHSFIHKWLLLTDPKDSSGVSKGYLKMSIMVIGPGDEPKRSPAYVSPEEVDIERNLLRPCGVQLQPATLTVRIYRAQDLPQMDPDYRLKKLLHFGSVPKKELVDPYCIVSYGGHTRRTEVKREDEDPEWNHELNLGVRFPSMCERIQFQLMDWDGRLNADDFIGTCYLRMSEISAQVEDGGFLPTFGPCFINLYGSPRKFSHLPNKYEYLNKGMIEGVAYRGRVMVELDMTLRKLPEKSDEEKPFKVDNKLEDRLAVLLRPQKFHLIAVFFSATMINPSDSPVEFEISIGNYGYRLDEEETTLLHSSTPEKNPVYDGNAYYFLPYGDRKPVVELECEWEDCLFRLEAMNMLNCIADDLEKGLNVVKKMLEEAGESGDKKKAETQLQEVLNEFYDKLTGPEVLPKLPGSRFTKLDGKLRKFRETELIGSKTKNGKEKIHPDPLQAIPPTLPHPRDSCQHTPGQDSVREAVEHLLGCWDSHTTEEVMDECQDYVCKLRELAVDPQSSIPDVIIWMLSGGKRVAVQRIPAHQLMYFDTGMKRGKRCGKIQTLFVTPPAVEKEEDLKDAKEGAQVQVMLWLGREEDFIPWTKKEPELCGRLAVCAEIYEHQYFFGRWPSDDLKSSSWTDGSGEVKLDSQDDFKEPKGWKWEGPWEKSPELSCDFNPEGGADRWEDEIFEYQHRSTPFSKWDTPEESTWKDVHEDQIVRYKEEGKKLKKYYLSKDSMTCPKGWVCEAWEVDTLTRKVDKDGWEYCVAPGLSKWVNSMKKYHLTRRRRWTRKRKLDPSISVQDTLRESLPHYPVGGWEYAKARLPAITYHVQEHWMDTTRRRRWLRKLVHDSSSEISRPTKPIFKLGDKEEMPRMYLSFEKVEDRKFYRLLVHLYQARGMYGSDFSGLSDPYAVVSFGRYTQKSRRASDTVSPQWEETLLFKKMEMYGEQSMVFQYPPPVVIEFFDKDVVGDNEYLGRVVCPPSVPGQRAKLEWYDITRYNKPAGELLAAFEFQEETREKLSWSKSHSDCGKKYYKILDTIRPETQEMKIEVLCWGVRDMKRYGKVFRVTSPFVEVECGGNVMTTAAIDNVKRNPNFPYDPKILKLHLPKNELYAPPLNINVYEKISYGIVPLVGSHCIKSVRSYRPRAQRQRTQRQEKTSSSSSSAPQTGDAKVTIDVPKDQVFDWWSKYYYSHSEEELRMKVQSGYKEAGYGGLQVIPYELENEYDLNDLLKTFPLFHGKGSHDANEMPDQVIGYLKGAVKISPLDGSPPNERSAFSDFPSPQPVEVVVRVYIVEGIDLQPKDLDGLSDPYIKVKIGDNDNEINDRKKYIPGQLNPVFGRLFELPAKLPIDHTLSITVMDWDRGTADDLIGTTTIDLEDRYFTRRHATCGLPEKYYKRGPFAWRDYQKPWDILEKQCADRRLAPPVWDANSREDDPQPTEDLEDDKQRSALQTLQTEDWGLVREHVETRTLYHPLHPNISQGALRMWVDVFPKDQNIPPPVDITPRQAEAFILRIVVWNVEGVPLKDDSIAGEKMSDIYIKGWLEGQEQHQKTDVHYRSLDGTGNFNFRFVFPFDYKQTEQKIVVKKKEHVYSLAKTENEYPPKVTLQVWDNDIFKANDHLGNIEFMLTTAPEPSKVGRRCSLGQLREHNPQARQIDLFKQKIARGWWPLYTRERPKEPEAEEEEKQCCGCLSCVKSTRNGYDRIEAETQRQERGLTEEPLNSTRNGYNQNELLETPWQERGLPEEPPLIQVGRIELEMEILTAVEAETKPAGKGREEPNMNPTLEEPQRPKTSFLWFLSPWKSFKYIVWKHWKWYIILVVVIILLVLLGVIFVYTIPSAFTKWAIDRVLP